jgi:hypothetical protein
MGEVMPEIARQREASIPVRLHCKELFPAHEKRLAAEQKLG